MQKATTTKPEARTLDEVINGLDEASRKKLDEFLAQISQMNDRGYVRLYDGQQIQLIFNLNSVINGSRNNNI